MLGYKGRSNRREFIGAAALLSIGPMAFSMLLMPAIPVLMGGPRDAAIVVGLLLTALVCVIIAVWFWGWTALVTRRARDIGWPAWAGMVATVAVMVLASLTSNGVLFGWIGIMAVLRSDAARPTSKDLAEIFV